MSRAAIRLLGVCAIAFGSASARAAPEEPPAWGTASPTVLEYASLAADVIVMCQARADTNGDGKVDAHIGHHGQVSGDRMRPYLCVGPGPGEEIDEFVAASRTGRHVVVVQKGRLLLVDVAQRTRVDLTALGADARDHGIPMWDHRAAHFDGGGRRVAWFRKTESGHGTIQVRDLTDGSEIVVEAGALLPVALWFDPGDAWLWMQAVAEDTDKDGALGFPQVVTSLDERPCRGSPRSYSVMAWTGDRFARYVVPTAGGKPRPAVGAFEAVGRLLLRRRPDGTLLTEDAAGNERVVAPAEASVRVRGIWRPGAVAVLEDTAGPDAGRYRLLRADGVQPLDLWSSNPRPRRADDDEDVPSYPARWSVNARDGERLVDLATGAPREVVVIAGLLAEHGHLRLLEKGGVLSILDVRTSWRTDLGITLEPERGYVPPPRWAGAVVFHRGHAIDLEAGRVVGTYPEHALAVSQDGRVLLPPDTEHRGLVQGPLRWTAPTPRPTSGAPGAGK